MKRQPIKRFTLLIILIGIILFTLIFRLVGIDSSVQSGALRFTQPIIQLFYRAGHSISSVFSRPQNVALLQSENEALRDEILDLGDGFKTNAQTVVEEIKKRLQSDEQESMANAA